MSGRAAGKRDDASTWPAHVQARLLDRVRGISTSLRGRPLKPEQVHRARRLLKEANALARLLEDCRGVDAKDASRGFARLRHKLNDVRDLDVIEASLTKLHADLPEPLRMSLAAAIAERRSEIDVVSGAAEGAAMREDVGRLAAMISGWELNEATPDALVASARRTYKSLRRRGAAAFDKRASHELHELRKPLIVHRYQMEALERAWPKLFRAWAGEAQHLRDKLGEHHDLMMLAEFASRVAGDEAKPLLALITDAQERLVDESEPVFDRLCAEKPGAFERRLLACLANAKKRVSAPPAEEIATIALPDPAVVAPPRRGRSRTRPAPNDVQRS
jgi:CHAD domain-containing protein